MRVKKVVCILLVAVMMTLSALPSLADTTGDSGDFTIVNGVLTKYNGTGGDVTIPSGVTSIGDAAFSNCTGLTAVSIPSSITGIGDYAFDSCTGLTSMTIPSSVATIGNSAFVFCTGLTSVTIPSSVTSIGVDAFANSGLTSVTIPSSVATIGDHAFDPCTALTNIEVDSNNPNYASINGALLNKDKSDLIQYPAGNTQTSYFVPNSVVSIENNAFDDSTNLKSITIPSSVVHINDGFYGCIELSYFNVDEANPDYKSMNGILFNKDATVLLKYPIATASSYTIPSSVTSIGGGAFKDCTGLTSVTIPSSVTSIGDGAFFGCADLASVMIPSSVTSIGNFTFVDCTGLTSVTIPSSVTSIGREAFAGCTSLTSVTIPNSVTSFGDGVFQNCTGLISVTVPSSVTSIVNLAFYGCTGLTNITIPRNVTSIGKSAFFGCTSLTSITIPSSVTEIQDYAFDDCTSLNAVYFQGAAPTSFGGSGSDSGGSESVFNTTANDFTIYYTQAYASSFALTNGLWYGYKTAVWAATASPHSVTITPNITNGSVASNVTTAAPGDTVTLTATPNAGYRIQTLTATYSGGTASITQNTNGAYSFTMPNGNVTVNATFVNTSNSGGSSGGGSSGSGSTGSTASPVSITGVAQTNSNGISITTATIHASDFNNANVSAINVNLGIISVSAPPAVFSSALSNDSTASLQMSQSASSSAIQTAAFAGAIANGYTPIAASDLNFARVETSGTSTALHQLSGSVTVTITLTAAQIASVGNAGIPDVYYYDTSTSTATLTDMNATYDTTNHRLTFTTNHFSTYLIATHPSTSVASNTGVQYAAHVQNIGWQNAVSGGIEAGTDHKSLRVEALKIKLTGSVPAGASIIYQAHVQNKGWMAAVSDDAVAGTEHKSLRIEALRVTLTGLTGYSVQYRVHVQNKGWMDWQTSANGTNISKAVVSGTTGKALRVEAVEIKLIESV